MDGSPVNILQISDIHIYADKKAELLGVKTLDSFQGVTALIKKNNVNPDVIILSGDLSQDGTEASYLHIAEQLQEFNVPVYYVPGNHDDPKVLTRIFPRNNISSHKHVVLKSWQLILLNSQKIGAVEGFLDRSQLNFLQHCLQRYSEHHALVILHHPPVPVGSAWLDKIGLSNPKEFWDIAMRYPKLAAVAFGHVHQEFSQKVNGIQCYAVPATCVQFKTQQHDFALENLPPGYRLFELSDNGALQTSVYRCAEYVGKFLEQAQGY